MSDELPRHNCGSGRLPPYEADGHRWNTTKPGADQQPRRRDKREEKMPWKPRLCTIKPEENLWTFLILLYDIGRKIGNSFEDTGEVVTKMNSIKCYNILSLSS